MQDPRLSKYKNTKNLSKKTVEEIDTLSLIKTFLIQRFKVLCLDLG